MERQLKIIALLLARLIAIQNRSFNPLAVLAEAEDLVPPTKAVRKKVARIPNVEMVQKYLDEKGFDLVNAEEFIAYYDKKGWKNTKGEAMSSWKTTARNWQNHAKWKAEHKTDN